MLREKSLLRHFVKFSGSQVKHNSTSTNNRDCATTISMVLGQLRAGKAWRPHCDLLDFVASVRMASGYWALFMPALKTWLELKKYHRG
jgi:hypothetical protein